MRFFTDLFQEDRSVLSLLEPMLAQLKKNDHRVGTVIEWIVRSPQFREVRGRDYKVD